MIGYSLFSPPNQLISPNDVVTPMFPMFQCSVFVALPDMVDPVSQKAAQDLVEKSTSPDVPFWSVSPDVRIW